MNKTRVLVASSSDSTPPPSAGCGIAHAGVCLGKGKHTPPCSSEELFFAEKNGGHRGKISVVDMVFIGFLYLPPGWKVFLRGQKRSPNDFLSVVVVYVLFFSVCVQYVAFCCHIWALHELHNIPNFKKIISKMI